MIKNSHDETKPSQISFIEAAVGCVTQVEYYAESLPLQMPLVMF